jgi:F-type H+-transporting ATPase subunit b
MFNMITLLAAWAQGAVEEPSGVDLVLPETNELIAGIIAFAIVFLVVWIWVRPKMSAMLAARQEAITGQLNEAEKTKLEAQSLLDDYKKQLASAKDEANKIVDEAKQAADAVKSDTVTKAQAEAATIIGKARSEAAAERDRVAGQMRDEVMSLSMTLTSKVVGAGIDAATQKRLVEQFIDDVGEMDA